MIKELVGINYATIIMLICLFVFLLTNDYFDARTHKLFFLSDILLLCLVTVDSVEYWTASLDHFVSARVWMSAIGYSLRPLIIYVVILLLGNARGRKYYWLVIPLIINTAIAFSAFFTDIAYSYSLDNLFVRGPIGYFAFITSGFYEIALLACTVKMYRSVRTSECVIAAVVTITFVVSSTIESVWKIEGLINASGAVALTFYYLYLNTQQFKRDSLTNVLNRRCFYMDAEKRLSELSAVLSVDLNDLKKWNDKFGHDKGDEAICTLVSCAEAALTPNSFLYRVGGDEFMILCFHQEASVTQKMKEQISDNMKKTPYNCAIGLALFEEGDSFESLCQKADEAMYQEKIRIKGSAR